MTLTIQGVEELNRRFNALADVARKEVLASALKVRAEIVRDAARSNAPVRTGRLRSSITIGTKRGTAPFEASIQVGPGKEAFYGYFVEFGTGSSFQAAAARALGYPGHSKSGSPSRKAQPFLIPAVNSTEDASIGALERQLQIAINKAAAS